MRYIAMFLVAQVLMETSVLCERNFPGSRAVPLEGEGIYWIIMYGCMFFIAATPWFFAEPTPEPTPEAKPES